MSEFQKDFVDEADADEDEDDDQGENVKSLSQKSSKKEKKITDPIKQIEQNLVDAKSAVKKHEGKVKELETLIKGQKGLAKKELKKVLKKEKAKITKIEDHIKKGDTLLQK
jgi:hypothetical protein